MNIYEFSRHRFNENERKKFIHNILFYFIRRQTCEKILEINHLKQIMCWFFDDGDFDSYDMK